MNDPRRKLLEGTLIYQIHEKSAFTVSITSSGIPASLVCSSIIGQRVKNVRIASLSNSFWNSRSSSTIV